MANSRTWTSQSTTRSASKSPSRGRGTGKGRTAGSKAKAEPKETTRPRSRVTGKSPARNRGKSKGRTAGSKTRAEHKETTTSPSGRSASKSPARGKGRPAASTAASPLRRSQRLANRARHPWHRRMATLLRNVALRAAEDVGAWGLKAKDASSDALRKFADNVRRRHFKLVVSALLWGLLAVGVAAGVIFIVSTFVSLVAKILPSVLVLAAVVGFVRLSLKEKHRLEEDRRIALEADRMHEAFLAKEAAEAEERERERVRLAAIAERAQLAAEIQQQADADRARLCVLADWTAEDVRLWVSVHQGFGPIVAHAMENDPIDGHLIPAIAEWPIQDFSTFGLTTTSMRMQLRSALHSLVTSPAAAECWTRALVREWGFGLTVLKQPDRFARLLYEHYYDGLKLIGLLDDQHPLQDLFALSQNETCIVMDHIRDMRMRINRKNSPSSP